MLKRILRREVLYIFLFLCATAGCLRSQKPVSEDQKWLERFFKSLLVEEEPAALFTLWGTKPITLIYIYHYTADEMIAHYTHLTEDEKARLRRDVANYDFPENWTRWEKIKHKFPSNQFLLFKNEKTSDEKMTDIYFVNILQTALVLQENYASFRSVVGFDFDPMTIVYEIENPKSEFWNKALSHSGLLGILFGYGAKNAWPFHWKYGHSSPCLKEVQQTFSTEDRTGPITLDNFPIPTFAIFEDSQIVEKYRKERAEIQKIYQGQDFLETTLKRFTSK